MTEKKSSAGSEVVKAIRRHGWIPDLPDHRDHLYGALRKISSSLPQSVDQRKGCSPVEDQGDIGSCTANAPGRRA